MTRLVLRNANLLDGRAPARPRTTIVIEGDRIAAVEPDSEVGDGIDVEGRSVMPGMVTAHFHSTYDELGAKPAPFGAEQAPAYQAVVAARNLATALRCGYTSAISAGAANDVHPSMAKAIRDGVIPGPRFLPGSRELSTTGHSNDTTPWYWDMRTPGAMRVCDGADGFRAGVREEIKRGARVIKLFVTGGHGTLAPKEQTELTRDELAAAIETAHSRGALVRGHITNKPAILTAIELGIDIIDHADDMDDECIEQLVAVGTFVVPSIHFPLTLLSGATPGPAWMDSLRADVDRMCEVLPKANAAGVRFLLGDDYGAAGFPHGRYGLEPAVYVEHAGIDPLDVLRWATVHGAEAMGRADDLGVIEPGKLADLLVIDGNPAVDISVLADAERLVVLQGGAVVAGSL
jgi:imidazolonepropionase-like amidohydrolase